MIPTPWQDDIARLEAAIQELRVIVSILMEPEAAERFREGWFGNRIDAATKPRQ